MDREDSVAILPQNFTNFSTLLVVTTTIVLASGRPPAHLADCHIYGPIPNDSQTQIYSPCAYFRTLKNNYLLQEDFKENAYGPIFSQPIPKDGIKAEQLYDTFIEYANMF